MRGERSSRRLEELCLYDTRYWFLSGGARPDHTTLSRFRKRLDRDGGLDELMRQVIVAATQMDLLGTRAWVVDGTKIPTSASQWRRLLEKADAQEMEEEPEAPKHKEAWDKDARTMKTTHGEYVNGFNLQVVVDSHSGIATCALASNSANDSVLLGEVLEAAATQSGMKPEALVADKGYDTAGCHEALEQAEVSGYICPKGKKDPPFKPDEAGTLRCLAGHEPGVSKTVILGVPYLQYRVSRCKDCPLKQQCGAGPGSRRYMKVRTDKHAKANAANLARCQSEEGKELLRCRGSTIERFFARMKRDLRMRRLHLKGLDGARLELLLACLALNLQTLLKAACARILLVLRLFIAVLYNWDRIVILTPTEPNSAKFVPR